MRVIITLVFFTLIMSCDRVVKSPDGLPRSSVGILSPTAITEEILDSDFVPGLSQYDVESRLGKAAEYKMVKNSLEAKYYISRELTTFPELTEFTIIYKNGKISSLERTFLAKRK